MKVAILEQDGQVLQHFDNVENFVVYEIIKGEIITKRQQKVQGLGTSALAGFLVGLNVKILICGQIDEEILNVLTANGIQVFTYTSGNVDEVIGKYLLGTLSTTIISNCSQRTSNSDCSKKCGSCGSCGSCGERY